MAFNWQCPYCGSFTTIESSNRTVRAGNLNTRSRHDDVAYAIISTTCPNPNCQEMAIQIRIGTPVTQMSSTVGVNDDEFLWSKQLWPEAKVMPLPKDIPEEIRTTYREAVLVSAISGRAGAAMSRRCLQGIVRDYFQIPVAKRGNLGAELSYVKDQVDPDLWDDIQALRGVGDIGAHMDKNVDQIIDVSPDEAQLLIELIETLFKDWYIARAKRTRNRAGLREMLQEKRTAQKAAKAGSGVYAPSQPPDQDIEGQ